MKRKLPSFKRKDKVAIHYCGGTTYGTVIKVNRSSIVIVCTDKYNNGEIMNFRKNKYGLEKLVDKR